MGIFVKLIAVVGNKNSGKTSVAAFLVHQLSNLGYNVGAIKHIHHEFSFDTKGKDTWRLNNAGATVVASVAPKELAIIRNMPQAHESFATTLRLFDFMSIEIAVVEGFREILTEYEKNVPKVVTAHSMTEIASVLNTTTPPIIAISGIVAEKTEKNEFQSIPIINYKKNGEELVQIVLEALSLKQ